MIGAQMFGRKTQKAEEERKAHEKQQLEEKHQAWVKMFDKAKNEHETTQLIITYRNEQLLEWLNDFDRRSAAEIRQQAKEIKSLVYGAAVIILLVLWWRV